MSLNELILFLALIGIGIIAGLVSGHLAAKGNRRLAQGMILALVLAITIPLALIILMAFFDGSLVSTESTGIPDLIGSAIGIIFLYGIGSSLVSGPPALISCCLMFRSRSNR